MTATASEDFKPEDYSRFLIREFLKINKMDKTYEMFMKEDTRPKVIMQKSKLTNLLGMESLVRHNAKTKTFNTMLDIIAHYLSEMRINSSGV